MTRRYYPPAFLRYLKPRLWNLARPSFWITAIFLSVLGLVIKEYWTNPDFLSKQEQKHVDVQQSADSSLSKEDKAIAADIDNSPALYSNGSQPSLQLPVTTSEQNNNGKTSSKDLTSKSQDTKSTNSGDTANSSPTLKIENPFLVEADNLLQGKNLQTESKLLSSNSPTTSSVFSSSTPTTPGSSTGVGTLNQTNNGQNSTSVNPQITQNQSVNQYPQALDGSNASTQPNPFVGQSLPTDNYTRQIIPSTTGLNTNTINTPAVTNYTQPQTTIQQLNPYSSINPYPYASAPSRYNVNRILNRYSNYSNSTLNQQTSSVVPSTTLVTPNTSTYTTPYYTQTPNQGIVNSYNSLTTNSWQQSPQRYQYNLSSPTQNLGQYPSSSTLNKY